MISWVGVLSVGLGAVAWAEPALFVLHENEPRIAISSGHGLTTDGRGVGVSWTDPVREGTVLGVWVPGDGLREVHFVDPESSGATGIETISGDGRSLVGVMSSTLESPGLAAFWSLDLGVINLGTLGEHPAQPGLLRSQGFAVQGSSVVGVTTSLTGDQAFRWTPQDGMVGLGTLGHPSDGYSMSCAMGVRVDGSVIGYSSTSDQRFTLARWEPNGTIIDLTPLIDSPGLQVFRASTNGTAMAGGLWGGDAPGLTAFVWSEAGGFVAIEQPADVAWLAASGVSDDGSVVVGSYETTPNNTGHFIWTPRVGVVDINDFVRDSLGVNTRGWTFGELHQVRADGRSIAGTVFRNSTDGEQVVSAFLLDIGAVCRVDFVTDGTLNFFDLGAFLAAFQSGDAAADIDGNGVFDVDDVTGYVGLFAAGCP